MLAAHFIVYLDSVHALQLFEIIFMIVESMKNCLLPLPIIIDSGSKQLYENG